MEDRAITMEYISSEDASTMSFQQVADLLKTDVNNGLTSEDINRYKEMYSSLNDITPEISSFLTRFSHNTLDAFDNPICKLFLIGFAVSLCMQWMETVFGLGVLIGVIVVCSILISTFQCFGEYFSQQGLMKDIQVNCNCMRSGTLQAVRVKDLIPGDVVYINDGDTIPADMRLFEANDLTIDESKYSGKEIPAQKFAEAIADIPCEGPHAGVTRKTEKAGVVCYCYRPNVAFMSTIVKSGSGKGIVTATCKNSEFKTIEKILSKMNYIRSAQAGAMSYEDVAAQLQTDVNNGLSQEAVAYRRKMFGKHSIGPTSEDGSPPALWKVFLSHFINPGMILPIGFMVLISLFSDNGIDNFIIPIGVLFLFIAIPATLNTINEYRFGGTECEPLKCKCMRNGNLETLVVYDLVPGDIVHLSQGSKVPVDLRLFEAVDLAVEEAIYHNVRNPPIQRKTTTDPITTELPFHTCMSKGLECYCHRPNVVFMGTVVRFGQGKGIVIATGEQSEVQVMSQGEAMMS